MKLPARPQPPAQSAVTLRPVFRYSASAHHSRTWIWIAGAALVVLVAASLLVPYLR